MNSWTFSDWFGVKSIRKVYSQSKLDLIQQDSEIYFSVHGKGAQLLISFKFNFTSEKNPCKTHKTFLSKREHKWHVYASYWDPGINWHISTKIFWRGNSELSSTKYLLKYVNLYLDPNGCHLNVSFMLLNFWCRYFAIALINLGWKNVHPLSETLSA